VNLEVKPEHLRLWRPSKDGLEDFKEYLTAGEFDRTEGSENMEVNQGMVFPGVPLTQFANRSVKQFQDSRLAISDAGFIVVE